MTRMTMRRRVGALVAGVLVIAAGLALRHFAGGAVAKLGGVALWAALVYCLVVAAAPGWPCLRAAAVALTISWAVELFQLTSVPHALSARSRLFHLVLGDTFSPPDLAAYLAGIAIVALFDRVVLR